MRERRRQKATWRSISCCLYKVYILQVSPSMMAGHPGVFACSTWTSGVIYCFTARIQQNCVAFAFQCPCVFGALSLCQSNRRWWILLGVFVQHGKLASRSRNESLASLDQKGQKAKHFCWFMVNKAWNSSIPRSIKMLWRLWCQRLLKLTLQVIKLSSDFKIQHVGHGKCMSFLQHFCTKPLILWKWAPFRHGTILYTRNIRVM